MLPDLSEFKKRRKILDLSPEKLASLADVSRPFIYKMERKEFEPSYIKMRRIDKALFNLEGKEQPKLRVGRVARDICEKKIEKVYASDPISNAINIMVDGGFSQLPVHKKDRIIGSITEHSILRAQSSKNDYISPAYIKVGEIMDPPFPQVTEATPIGPIRSYLEHYPAVIVTKEDKPEGKPVGIITKTDLIKIQKFIN